MQDQPIAKPFDLSQSYWDGLSRRSQELYALIRPMPNPVYTVDWPLGHVERALENAERDSREMGGSFELVPDFQRGHVWTQAQQSAYVESLLRGSVTGRVLFNCPGWTSSRLERGDIPLHTFQCIDGLQRLTAIRKFAAGELSVFGGLCWKDLDGTAFSPRLSRYRVQVAIYEFTNRADLLRLYLDLNAGGTVHAPSEIERVQGLLQQAVSGGDGA